MVPRVIAATFVALMLYSVVAIVGLTGSYVFVVYVQHVTPGNAVNETVVFAFMALFFINILATAMGARTRRADRLLRQRVGLHGRRRPALPG